MVLDTGLTFSILPKDDLQIFKQILNDKYYIDCQHHEDDANSIVNLKLLQCKCD
jgi:hypothetical protein